MSLSQALQYLQENHDRFLAELEAFLRIPSVSTTPEHKDDIARAANWGGRVSRVECDHPCLVTSSRRAIASCRDSTRLSPSADRRAGWED